MVHYMLNNTIIKQKKIAANQQIVEKKYWHNTLAGRLPGIKIPYDFENDATHFDSSQETFTFSEEVSSSIIEICNNSDYAINAFLITSIFLLVSKYNDSDDIIIATPIYKQEDTTDFINTLVFLRNKINGDLKSVELLQQVAESIYEANEHQNYPFEVLFNELEKIDPANTITAFDIGVIYNTIHDKSYLSHYQPNILFTFNHEGKALTCTIEYNKNLYKQTTIKNLHVYLNNIITRIHLNKYSTVKEISLITPEEKNKILDIFNDTQYLYSMDYSIDKLFEQKALEHPNKIAVSFNDECLTYNELNKKANQLARNMLNSGIKPQSIIGICMFRSLELMIGILAIVKAGCAYMPIDPKMPDTWIKNVVKRSKTTAIVTKKEYCNFLDDSITMINIDDPSSFIKDGSNLDLPVDITAPVYVIHTSGSTGRPKGVVIEHKALLNRLMWMQRKYPIGAKDVILQKTPFTFDVSVWELFWWIIDGSSIHFLEPEAEKNPEKIIQAIQDKNITTMHFVPSMLHAFLEYIEHYGGTQRLKSLKQVFASGEELKIQHVTSFNNLLYKTNKTRIINLYGPTEAAIDVTYFDDLTHDPGTLIPIGKPIDNISIYIMNKDLNMQPIGMPGELYIAGDGLARGYLNDERQTNDKFIEIPFNPGHKMYKSGDLARWLPDGNIEFLGRKDNQVKIRGFRIELGEIELHLLNYPGISKATVIAKKNEKQQNYLCGYFVGTEKIDTDHLKEHLVNNVPEYMVPPFLIQVDSFSVTRHGKLDRSTLPDPMKTPVKISDEKLTSIEKNIMTIWLKILKTDAIGLNDSFIENGGDSLKLIQLNIEISKEFGINIGFNTLVELDTIKKTAEYITQNRAHSEQNSYPSVTPDPTTRYNPFPLTNVQMAYLLGRSDLFEIGGVSTHIYQEIITELDLQKLNTALNQVIKRHPMLRTVIYNNGTQQVLDTIKEYEIIVEDISGMSPDQQEKRITQERSRMSHFIFKTDQWPMFDIKGFKLDDKTSCLCVGIDPLIADAFSLRIISDEIITYYNNPDAPLKPITFTFKDYVLALEKLKSSRIYEIDRDYWQKKVPEFSTAPQLVLKDDPAVIKTPQFNQLSTKFDHIQWKKLTSIAGRNKITASIVLLTAYAQVLSYWSNQKELALNLTLYNRLPFHEDVNAIVGDFTSIILLDIKLTEHLSFWEKARIVQETLLDALTHRHYDGIQVIRDLAKYNKTVNKAIMPVVFTSAIFDTDDASQNTASPEIGREKDGRGTAQTSQVYLDNVVSEENGILSIKWNYVEQLFDAPVIAKMFEQYNWIINRVINDDVMCDLSTESNADELMTEYNATDYDIELESFPTLFMRQVNQCSNKTAVEFGDESMTYDELNKLSNQIAYYLIDQGVTSNEYIAVDATRSIYTIANILGILKAGAAYVPIDPEYPQNRVDYILHNSNCKVFISHDIHHQGTINKYPETNICNIKSLDDIAYVIYTSGSTGNPKGVVIKHSAFINTVLDINDMFDVGQNDKILGISSLCFDLSVYDVFGALTTGATLVLIEDQRNIDDLLTIVNEKQITFWNSVPAIMDLLVKLITRKNNNDDETKYINNTLRVVLLSGDWIPLDLPDTIKTYFPSSKVISLGGATEASIWSIYYPIEDIKQNWKSIPYGYPLRNQKMYVLNYEYNICPSGVRGEIFIGGIGVAEGYINDMEKTERAFIEHPQLGRIYKTGDHGIFHEEGYIEFLGRIDNQVKIHGYRIEIGEIESQILKINFIENCIVAVKQDTSKNSYLCAYYVTKTDDGAFTYEQEIRKQLIAHLPTYMIPKHFIKLDKIPLMHNGKIDRKNLPELKIEAEKRIKPNTKEQNELVAIWAETLGIDKNEISAKDNFFEIGGDSVKAIELISHLKETLHKEIKIVNIYRYPTLKELAEHIKSDQKQSEAISSDRKKIIQQSKMQRHKMLLKRKGR